MVQQESGKSWIDARDKRIKSPRLMDTYTGGREFFRNKTNRYVESFYFVPSKKRLKSRRAKTCLELFRSFVSFTYLSDFSG